jgi:uncharacterized membrane protein
LINRFEMKSKAKAQIKGNIGILFICHLIISVISALLSPVLLLGLLIAPALNLSLIMIYLALGQNVRPSVADTLKGLDLFGKSLWLAIITSFFTFLWSLLFIIPGIVKGYAYLMAPYILADNPSMTAREALKESVRITNGHKGDLFVLQLSFIGWVLLVPLTLGLIVIWLAPYANATLANYYIAMKNSNPAPAQSSEQKVLV